jgi:hypothetical protein
MQSLVVVEIDEPGDCLFSMCETVELETPHYLLLQYGVERFYVRIIRWSGGMDALVRNVHECQHLLNPPANELVPLSFLMRTAPISPIQHLWNAFISVSLTSPPLH